MNDFHAALEKLGMHHADPATKEQLHALWTLGFNEGYDDGEETSKLDRRVHIDGILLAIDQGLGPAESKIAWVREKLVKLLAWQNGEGELPKVVPVEAIEKLAESFDNASGNPHASAADARVLQWMRDKLKELVK